MLSTDTSFGFSDLHNSVLVRLFDEQKLDGLEDERYPVNIKGLERANTKMLFLSIGVARFSMLHRDTFDMTHVLTFIQQFRKYSQQHYPLLEFTPDHHSVENAQIQKKTAYVFALEGSHLLAGELRWIDSLYEAGVRMVSMAHWFHNHFLMLPGDSLLVQNGYNKNPSHLSERTVLSPKGIELLEYLIKKKILIDVSHLPKNAFWEVIKINANRRPLVASHSNAKAICDTPRNLSNEQIKAIAASGGLIGLSLHKPMISVNNKNTNVSDFVDHLEYILDLVSDEHVAIGTDLEGRINPPEDLRRIEQLSIVQKELQRRGFKKSEIENIMWKNVMNLL